MDKIDLDVLRAKKRGRREGSANTARRRSTKQRAANLKRSTSKVPQASQTPPAAGVASPTVVPQPAAMQAPREAPTTPQQPPSACAASQTVPAASIASQMPPEPLPAVSPGAASPESISGDCIQGREDGSAASDDEGTKETCAVIDEESMDEESKDDSQLDSQNEEDPGKYAGFESDATNDDGDDEDGPVETIEPGIAQVPVPPEMRFDANLLSSLGGLEKVAAGAVPDTFLKEMGWVVGFVTHTPYDYLQESFEARSPDAMQKDYPRLYTGDSGPTPRALYAASSPSGAFFYFLQPQLWEDVAAETNDYFDASIDERVEGQHAKQLKRALKHPEFKVKSRDAIREDVLKVASIEPRE
ncbi:LOW QUALITY PROTEIN: hypothetical protein PHMEG_00037964, partial [Phytophthora megakarya]